MKASYALGIILVALFIVFIAPFALIWSLNTLFPILNIPFTFETWLAAFVIPAAFKSEISFKGKN